MGGMLTQPDTNKRSDEGQGLGLKYGLSSMQGWRLEMEDAHDVKLGLDHGLSDWSFFAVFDGHAGKCSASYAAWNLHDYILEDSEFALDIGKEPRKGLINGSDRKNGASLVPCDGNSEEDLQKQQQQPPLKTENLSDSLSRTDKKDINQQSKTEEQKTKTPDDEPNKEPKPKFASFPLSKQLEMVKKAIRSGFLRLDDTMRSYPQDMSGCTAVCTFISPTHIFIANCGDSRAVLYDGKTEPRFATEDHKPINPKERKRIIDAGGTATQRINGTLAVSRALGDFEFKRDTLRGPCEQLVSPEPEVTVIERQSTDEFLILACDGIWDVISNNNLCQYVRYQLKIEPSLEKICSSVIDICLRKGSRDNMSVIIVVFENGPTLDQAAIMQELRNDEKLKEHMLDYLNANRNLTDDFPGFLAAFSNDLDEEYLDKLPPGVGIEAKYELIRKKFEGEEDTPVSTNENENE